MPHFLDIHFPAVLTATLVGFAIGALWYSPLLFGRTWMALMNFDERTVEEAKRRGMGKTYAAALLNTFVLALILSIFVRHPGATHLWVGLLTGFFVWLGFMVTIHSAGYLWEGKPAKLFFLNAGHSLVSVLVMSAVLSLWP
jgi:hypothetical protein